jgi:hypothetical protein
MCILRDIKTAFFHLAFLCLPLFSCHTGNAQGHGYLPNINHTTQTGTGLQLPGTGFPLKFPWAGGLNSCQFCAIDLNLDGRQDLLCFDRHGNRKLTFINQGTPNVIDYTNEPAFALKLPDLHDWVLTADYNCDGKMDIFTYGMGGVRVFQNISDTSLKFRLVTGLLESYYYTGKVGILVTSVDYPALADIDNDGDLDLLTFFGLGSFVEYHKNLSKEKYGHCDSLDFRLADPCWGKFKESEGGNRIVLNVGCGDGLGEVQSAKCKVQNGGSRHTGSTLMATDLNGDGLKDLVLGDVDYPGLVALFNGGTLDSALMVAQDTAFPASSLPVNLFSFPAVSDIDIDNDGLSDLMISPFDPTLHTSENYNCIRFYKNTGSAVLPHYEIQAAEPFRDDMLDFGSASHPVLFDFDGDGLQDLFVGNDGIYDSSWYKNGLLYSAYTSKIAYYRNEGTPASPVFKLMNDDLAGISTMQLRGAFPTFADLNGDSRPDMVVGNSDGSLIAFMNNGTGEVIPDFNPPILHWQGIDVGDFSTPQLFDLDKDNKTDLVIGEQNGNLNWYKNTGTAGFPAFSAITDSLGKVNVTNYGVSYDGFSTPCFSRFTDGTTFLLCGSDEGRIHLFTNIDQNLQGKFTGSSTLYQWLASDPADTLFGWQTSPAIARLTDLSEFDMITGNFAGGLNYITKRSTPVIIQGIQNPVSAGSGILKVYPNPADNSVTVDSPPLATHAPHLTITDIYGRPVLHIPFSGKSTFSVSALASGIYLIHLGQAISKLVITHP